MLQFKNTNWWSLSLDNLFLAGRSVIFFAIYRQAWCTAWMFTRLKSRDRDRDVISSRPRWDRDVEPSRPRRDRDVWFFQTLETETRQRRSTFKTETRWDVPKKTSQDCLETETFKTETTSLRCTSLVLSTHTHWMVSLLPTVLIQTSKPISCCIPHQSQRHLELLPEPRQRWNHSNFGIHLCCRFYCGSFSITVHHFPELANCLDFICLKWSVKWQEVTDVSFCLLLYTGCISEGLLVYSGF